VIVRWPHIDDSDDAGNEFLAINNCLNEVCHGFTLSPEEWSKWFQEPKADVQRVYQTWLSLRGMAGGIR
jgi:hypothetical protein